MGEATALSAAFWASWTHGEPGGPERENLERQLHDALATAREAWPTVELPDTRFAEAVAQRIDPDAELPDAVQRIHASDVYLASACADGLRQGIEAFEAGYLEPLRPAIARIGATAAMIDDIVARLRARLLAPSEGRPPVIAQYMGRGDLSSWLKVVAMREAVAMLRKNHHIPAEDDEVEALLSPSDDPELEVMRQRYSDEFRRAFERALGSLEVRERNVLRYHLLDRLSIDQIAAIHSVHRATAARWLARVRETLYARTRRELLSRLGVSTRELDSIFRLLRSQLDVSIGRHLS